MGCDGMGAATVGGARPVIGNHAGAAADGAADDSITCGVPGGVALRDAGPLLHPLGANVVVGIARNVEA